MEAGESRRRDLTSRLGGSVEDGKRGSYWCFFLVPLVWVDYLFGLVSSVFSSFFLILFL